MLHRRKSAIPALLLAVTGALTSCGFHSPTERVNQIAAGDNNRDAQVDALGIRILSAAQGEGRLIGALVNNHNDKTASLDAVNGEEAGVTAELEPVEVAPNGHVNLARDAEVAVSGEFVAGDVVPLTLEFSTGESVDLNVPVVKPCFQYTEDPALQGGGAEVESSETEFEAHAEETGEAEADAAETDGAPAEETGEAEADAEETDGAPAEDESDATYNCADEAPAPAEGH